jgi:hypothetical protein
MRILIDIGHPAHIHLFKYFIWEMEKRGHETIVSARDKDVTKNLLDAYKIPYTLIGKQKEGSVNLAKEWLYRTYKIIQLGRQTEPDFFLGMANPAAAYAAMFLGKKSITFTDTEHGHLQNQLTFPVTDVILTPSCYRDQIGAKQIRYPGYHELAYLHPNHFIPNPAILDEIGVSAKEPFSLIRFVSWEASHDIGQSGLSLATKRKAVDTFSQFGRVFITSEKPLPDEFEKYRITVSPEKMHDILNYATLIYGESATMTSEAAVLGVHGVYCDSFGRGYTDDEEKYGLVYNFLLDDNSQNESIEKAAELLGNKDLKQEGQKKRQTLLNDKIDVTKFMVWFIENYPKSTIELKQNPNLLKNFQ